MEINYTTENHEWKWEAIWNVSNGNFGLNNNQEKETMDLIEYV